MGQKDLELAIAIMTAGVIVSCILLFIWYVTTGRKTGPWEESKFWEKKNNELKKRKK